MASYNAANSIHNAEYDSGESQLPQTVKVRDSHSNIECVKYSGPTIKVPIKVINKDMIKATIPSLVCSWVDLSMYDLHLFLEEGQILQFADLRKILDNSKIGPGKKLKLLKRIVNEIVTAGEYENFLEEKRANPKWSRYEIILLVGAYKEHGANCETIAHELRTKKPMQVRQFISRHREFLDTISAMPDNGERHTYLKQYMQIPTRNPSPLTTTIKLADQIETSISDSSGAVSLDSNADYSDNLVDMAELPEHSSSDEYVEPDSEDNEIMEMDEQPEPMHVGNEKNSFDESSVDKVIYEAKIDNGINSAIDLKSNLIDQTETSSSSSFMSVSCPSPSSSSPILTPPSMGKISQSNMQQQSQTISHHDNVLTLTRSQCESILDQPMSHSMNESSFGSNLNVFGNQVTLHKPMPLQMTQCNTHMTIDSHKVTCESVNLKTSFIEPTHSNFPISVPTHSKSPIPALTHSNVPIPLQNHTLNYAKLPVHSQTYHFVPTSIYSNVPDHAARFAQVPVNMNAHSISHGTLSNHAHTTNPMYRDESTYSHTPTNGTTALHPNAPERASTFTQLPVNSRQHTSSYEASFTHNQLPTQAHPSNQAPVASYSESPYGSHQLTYKPLPAYLNTPKYAQTHSNVPVREPTSSQVPYRPLYETGSTRTQQATHLQNAAPETGHTYPYTPSYAQTRGNVHTFAPNHAMFNAQIHRPLYDNYRMSAQASQFHTQTYDFFRTHSHVPTPTNPNVSTLPQVPFSSHMHNTESYEAYSNRTQMPWQTLNSNIATYGHAHYSHAPTHGNALVMTHHPTYVSRTFSNDHMHGPSPSSQMPFETHVHNSFYETLSSGNQTVSQTPIALYGARNTHRNYHTNANTSPFSNVPIQPFYKTSSTSAQFPTHPQNSNYAAYAQTRENVLVRTATPNQLPFDRQIRRPLYENNLFQKSAQASHHHSQNFEHFRTHSNVPKNANPNFASSSQVPCNAHIHSAPSYQAYSNRIQTASQPLRSNIATYKSANQSLKPTQVPTHANTNITAPPQLSFNGNMHSKSSNVSVTATHNPTYPSTFSNISMHAPSPSTQVVFEANVNNPLHETLSTRKQTLSQTSNALNADRNTSRNYHAFANPSSFSRVPVPASTTSTQRTFDEESHQPIHESLTSRTQNSTHVPQQNQLLRNTTFPVSSQIPASLSEPAHEAVAQEYAPLIRNTQAPTGVLDKLLRKSQFEKKLIEKQKPTAEIVESDKENDQIAQHEGYKRPLIHFIIPASEMSEMKFSHMVADYKTQQCNSRLNQVLKELRMRNKNVSIQKQNFRSNKVEAPMSMNTAKANKKFTIQGLQTKARFLLDIIQNDDLLTKQLVSDTFGINLFKKTDSTLSFRPTPGKREPMFELIKPHHSKQL